MAPLVVNVDRVDIKVVASVIINEMMTAMEIEIIDMGAPPINCEDHHFRRIQGGLGASNAFNL
jgi:hypothetical protein